MCDVDEVVVTKLVRSSSSAVAGIPRLDARVKGVVGWNDSVSPMDRAVDWRSSLGVGSGTAIDTVPTRSNPTGCVCQGGGGSDPETLPTFDRVVLYEGRRT